MSEFWIVSEKPLDELSSFAEAVRMRERLSREFEGRTFRIYRCKRWLNPERHFAKAHELLGDIAAHAARAGEAAPLPGALYARVRLLLATINKRNQTPHMVVNNSVPEFEPRRPRR